MTKLNKIIANFESDLERSNEEKNRLNLQNTLGLEVLRRLSEKISQYAKEKEVLASHKINEVFNGITYDECTSHNIIHDHGTWSTKLIVTAEKQRNDIKVTLISGNPILKGETFEESFDPYREKEKEEDFVKAFVALCQ